VAGCGGDAPVARQQRRIERFCKGDVDGVVGREVVPQVPYARQEEIARIPGKRKVREVGQRCAATLLVISPAAAYRRTT